MQSKVYITPPGGNLSSLCNELHQLFLMHDYQVQVVSFADGSEVRAAKKSPLMLEYIFGSSSVSGLPKFLYDSGIAVRILQKADGVSVEVSSPSVAKKVLFETALWLALPFPPLIVFAALSGFAEWKLVSQIWESVEKLLADFVPPQDPSSLTLSYRCEMTPLNFQTSSALVPTLETSVCSACHCVNQALATTCSGCGLQFTSLQRKSN